ncbi:MAG TPA: AbrB/MazE/SpoVT family DNA-binding domain-containing protein [Acetobacteraceae bacterium]|nr:AbrB/MazE/SpoVT family DNA-binding domain-containing protein [Acetobacteraceae bacterium]
MITTKLQKLGNSTGVVLPRKVLAAARLELGDEVLLNAEEGRIEITKTEEGYNRAMEIGRAFSQRYRQTMAILSR